MICFFMSNQILSYIFLSYIFYFYHYYFLKITPTQFLDTRPILWRRHSTVLNSYDSFEHNSYQYHKLKGLYIDPREPDPVYVTLREANRIGFSGRLKRAKSLPPRRRCNSDQTNTYSTSKLLTSKGKKRIFKIEGIF